MDVYKTLNAMNSDKIKFTFKLKRKCILLKFYWAFLESAKKEIFSKKLKEIINSVYFLKEHKQHFRSPTRIVGWGGLVGKLHKTLGQFVA